MEKIVYLLFALIPIGIITVIIFIVSKKENAKLEDLLSNMSPEDLAELKNKQYSEIDGNKKLSETMGLVASVTDKGAKSMIKILFYNVPRDEIYSVDKKISSEDIASKGIRKGAFIPCIMKFDEEYQIHYLKEIK